MSANSRVTTTLLSIMVLLLISLLASPLISTAAGKNSTEDQYEDKCPGAKEVETIETTKKDEGRLFNTRGDTFRVTYTVKFSVEASGEAKSKIRVKIKKDLGSSLSRTERKSGSYSFLVSEGAGSYKVKTNATPDEVASYTLTVEDCTGESKQQPSTHPKHPKTTVEHPGSSLPTPKETEHPKTAEHPKSPEITPENPDYAEDVDDEKIMDNVDDSDILDDADSEIPDNVDKGTIPNEKLPNTGGPPVFNLLLFGGLGIATVTALIGLTARVRRR